MIQNCFYEQEGILFFSNEGEITFNFPIGNGREEIKGIPANEGDKVYNFFIPAGVDLEEISIASEEIYVVDEQHKEIIEKFISHHLK